MYTEKEKENKKILVHSSHRKMCYSDEDESWCSKLKNVFLKPKGRDALQLSEFAAG
jgi:hypothetical protein